jgi:transcriptional regulator with XRE-family HTH domain
MQHRVDSHARGIGLVRSTFSPRYQAFLTKLRQAREEAGMTQVEVAAKLGKPQSYVSKCESGERRVDVIELAAFAALYGRPLVSFVPDTP